MRGITESEFGALYGQYRDPLFRFGYRLTGSVEVAEDLVHDCFVGLFRGAYDEGLGSMQTYLYSSLRNLCRKHYRDSGREELTDEPEESVTAGGQLCAEHTSQLDAIISREIAATVQCAVASLPLLQREALVLFEYEGLALDEISKVVEADLGAVKSRLHRARVTLRKLLLAVREATR